MSTVTPRTSFTPEENLGKYLRDIRHYPILTASQEIELAQRWLDTGNDQAADALVTSHLRLVAKIAMGFRGYGLPLSDLISEGNVGLLQAVRRFDPDKGYRFSTYAMWWIRAAVQEFILRSWSLVKMGTTAAQKKLFFNLRRLKSTLQVVEDGDMTPDQVEAISARLHVPTDEVISMNRRMMTGDHSLNAPLSRDGETDGQWQDMLEDESENQEHRLADHQEMEDRRRLLAQAMLMLNDRERFIFQQRRLTEESATLEELSHHYGISRERVRQIEVRAFEKVQKSVRTAMIRRQVHVGHTHRELQAA